MSKFASKLDLKKSLLDNITLLHKNKEYIWVEFQEIKEYLNQGFEIFNKDKKELCERIKQNE